MKSYFTKKRIFSVVITVLGIIAIVFFNDSKQTFKNLPEKSNVINHDFLFVLSWSPTYCLEQDPEGKQTQCRKNLPKQYRFIVHGLWPQSQKQAQGQEQEKYLAYCRKVDKRLEANIIEKYFYLMPSSRLMLHEWEKHASCGHFSQQSYFKTIEDLYKKFDITHMLQHVNQTQSFDFKRLINDLVTHIPQISRENMVIVCRKNYLSEVRLCLNKEYMFRKCHYQELKAGHCRLNEKITVPVLK